MSRADEWAQAIRDADQVIAGARSRLDPSFIVSDRLGVEATGIYAVKIAKVTKRGGLKIQAIASDERCEMTAGEALMFADWIYRTFSDARPA